MRYQLAIPLLLLLGLPQAAVAEDLAVTLAVRDGGFVPAEPAVPVDTRVRLEVANETGAAIEFESFDLNRERVIPAGQKATIYLSGLPGGRYEFFDDFHQERRGALLVR